jgi:spore maturation protein CgeB
VAKCSGVGGWDLELARGVVDLKGPGRLVAHWDVDAPQTLAAAEDPADEFRELIPRFDLILLYGGGPPVQERYGRLGARAAHLVYNGVDLDEYYPVAPEPDRCADLLFMGNRLPDREARVAEFFFRAAQLAPELRFVLGGEGWGDGVQLPPNVRWIGHVPTAEHRGWNASARMVLNVVRESMASNGYSPPTRVFEAAGCGSCVLTDAWTGVEAFFEPEAEILVVGSAEEIVRRLRETPIERSRAIGAAARRRVLRDHTYAQRAEHLERALQDALAQAGGPPAPARLARQGAGA